MHRHPGVGLAILLAACGGGQSPAGEGVTVENRGRMCLHDRQPDALAPGAQSFAVDAAIVVQVALLRCLSSTCDTDAAMSCEVMASGTALAVSSIASYTHEATGPCTPDCGQLAATCTTDPLPAGDYQFAFADTTLSLTVPSEAAEPPCSEVPDF